MISVDEALRLVLEQSRELQPTRSKLEDSLGCVLAEDVASDLDSPPWDKSMVDGYALHCGDLSTGVAELPVLEEVVAGAVATQAVQPGTATRIMTGAPIPEGADCVVMVERTTLPSENRVRIEDSPPKPGQNILRRGRSFRRGDVIVPARTRIGPVQIGLLCEVGCAVPLIVPRPRVAILSTGNELVGAEETPSPGQIRNSNGPMLAALVARHGATPINLGVARDEREDLRRLIATGLDADVLVLSGGVSAGVLDLVPSVLAELGVEQVFHKVRIKPGKPLWFGVRRAGSTPTLVFGLPGNPVSSLVGFELFVRPALTRLAGLPATTNRELRVRIGAGTHQQRGDRPTYYPAALEPAAANKSDLPVANLLSWQGSADLRGLATADLLAIFPAGDRLYERGVEADAIRI